MCHLGLTLPIILTIRCDPMNATAPPPPNPNQVWRAPQLCVVVPTFNESANVTALVQQLERALSGVAWEVVFVDDDSPDQTFDHAWQLSRVNPRVRCLRRVGRRGLATACIEGMLSTAAPYVAVMDGDLQHDETRLPLMLKALRDDGYDLAVGSRYTEGGSTGAWSTDRVRTSRVATTLAQRVLRAPLHDPMSGFFMLKRDVLQQVVHRLSGMGFKILLDIVASAPTPLRIHEVPFEFRQRQAGQSKLDERVIYEFLLLLVDKTIGRFIPTRLVSFAAVGGLGVGVHLAILSTLLMGFGAAFTVAQTSAVVVSMMFNFFVNNTLTYQDKKLTGWALLPGLLKFMAACALGASANVGVASYLYADWGNWFGSGLAGIVVGLFWNYSVTSMLVWSGRGRV